MRTLSAETLLLAWERGRSRHPIDRAVMLHALAAPEADPESLADEPLGQRNAALMRLRQANFGDTLRAYLDCPRCEERLEFDADAAELLAVSPEAKASIEVEGLSFRPPSSRDLAMILNETDTRSATLRVMRRCLVSDEEEADEAALEPLMDRVEACMERADPWADFKLDLRCEACGHAWVESFDIAGFLWEEIDAYVRRLLDEIHLLAQAYGWSESVILGLSEVRRAAYLERVTT